MPVWLKAKQSSLHLMGICWCAILRKKGAHVTILVVIMFLACCQRRSRNRKNHHSFVGSCPVWTVFRHVRSTQKEQFNNHMVRGCSTETCHVTKNPTLMFWAGRGHRKSHKNRPSCHYTMHWRRRARHIVWQLRAPWTACNHRWRAHCQNVVDRRRCGRRWRHSGVRHCLRLGRRNGCTWLNGARRSSRVRWWNWSC